jgi:hypothetical protein
MERRAIAVTLAGATGALALAAERPEKSEAAPAPQTSGLATRCGWLNTGPQNAGGPDVWVRLSAIQQLAPTTGGTYAYLPGQTPVTIHAPVATVLEVICAGGSATAPPPSATPSPTPRRGNATGQATPTPTTAPSPTPGPSTGGPPVRCGYVENRPGALWLLATDVVTLQATSPTSTAYGWRTGGTDMFAYPLDAVIDALCAAGA